MSNNRRCAVQKKPTPVIIVTDIGADIDDTLALFVMLGASQSVEIKAIVTSVNNGQERGALTRGYLRLLGINDQDIEILPSLDNCVAKCAIPETFPSPDNAALGDPANTPQRIVEICQEHEDTGIILYGIASLTPVADAISLNAQVMKRAVRRVYLQGNVDVEKENVSSRSRMRRQTYRLSPNPQAYNFKNDMDAAQVVFDTLQDTAAFVTLGKFAAYKIPVTRKDFRTWTGQLNRAHEKTSKFDVSCPNPPDLLLAVQKQLQNFREGNPEKFDSIYKVPTEEYSDEELRLFKWFEHLPDDYVCCHPYDPLLATILIEHIKKPKLTSPNSGLNFLGTSKILTQYYHRNKNGHFHVVIGNTPEKHSVLSVGKVHKVLAANVSAGLVSRIKAEEHSDNI